MHPPHINSKNQLENFGRLFFPLRSFFCSEKHPLEESEPLTEISKLSSWKGAPEQNFCTLRRADKGYRQHAETTILLLLREIPQFVLPQGSPYPILLRGTGKARKKDITEKWPDFLLEGNALFSDTLKGFVVLGWVVLGFFGKTLILGSLLKAKQNIEELRIS